MKKITSFLVFVLTLGFIVSNGLSNSIATVSAQEDRIEIKFLNGFTGGDGAFMKAITDGFNESQDQYFINEVQEVDHYVQFTTGDFDLVVMHGTNMATFRADGLIQEMTPFYEQAGLSLEDFHPVGADIVQFDDGGIFGVPLDIHPLTTFYNKQLVDEAPETYEDLVALNEELQAENENLYALGIPDTGLVEFYTFLIAAQNGIDLQGEGFINFAQEGMAEALMIYHDAIYVDKISPAGLGLDGEFQSFMSEGSGDTAQTAVALTGPWYYAAVRDTLGDDLGIGTIPLLGEQPALYGNSHNISVSSQVTEEDEIAAIAAFLEYLYTPENLINWADAGQAPLHLGTMELIEEQQEDYPLAYRNQTQFDNYVTAPQVYQFGEQVRYMNETVFGMLVREENLTIEELQAELETATQMAQEIGSMGTLE